jgi:tetratricopeptide (TPR) repeat protein
LERYAPVYSELARRARKAKRAKEAVRQYEEDFVHVCGRIIRRARKGLQDSIESTDELFRDALDHLLILLGDFRESGLLARMVLQNTDRIQKLFGKQGVHKVFKAMYRAEWLQGYLLAARNYLESGWHDEAKEQVQKALELDPKNLDALQLARSLEG